MRLGGAGVADSGRKVEYVALNAVDRSSVFRTSRSIFRTWNGSAQAEEAERGTQRIGGFVAATHVTSDHLQAAPLPIIPGDTCPPRSSPATTGGR